MDTGFLIATALLLTVSTLAALKARQGIRVAQAAKGKH